MRWSNYLEVMFRWVPRGVLKGSRSIVRRVLLHIRTYEVYVRRSGLVAGGSAQVY